MTTSSSAALSGSGRWCEYLKITIRGTHVIMQDIEAELSYAYLHAVAAKAGMECSYSPRISDKNGIDARICARKNVLPSDSKCGLEVNISIQLKATIHSPYDNGSHLSYCLNDIKQYNALRAEGYDVPRLLVVYFLPKDANLWLKQNDKLFLLRKSAYWVSLLGAPESENNTSQTIYIPKRNLLTPEALINIVTRRSRWDFPKYGEE